MLGDATVAISRLWPKISIRCTPPPRSADSLDVFWISGIAFAFQTGIDEEPLSAVFIVSVFSYRIADSQRRKLAVHEFTDGRNAAIDFEHVAGHRADQQPAEVTAQGESAVVSG